MKNYNGQKFNKMTVIETLSSTKVVCKCDCGNIKTCDLAELKREKIKACGCMRNNTDMRLAASIRAKNLQQKGILNKGGNQYPIKYREYKYIWKAMKNTGRKPIENLSLEDLHNQWQKQKGVCPYTKIPLILPTHKNYKGQKQFLYASLDRIDSSLPYTRDNIQFVSRNINFAKQSMTHEETCEFIEIIKNS
jgi:hypothetical protein